jgi:carbamoylphosphate synthase large subunit
MGGQTALNCALDLHRNGVLDKYKVELIGATPKPSTRPKTAPSSRTR